MTPPADLSDVTAFPVVVAQRFDGRRLFGVVVGLHYGFLPFVQCEMMPFPLILNWRNLEPVVLWTQEDARWGAKHGVSVQMEAA